MHIFPLDLRWWFNTSFPIHWIRRGFPKSLVQIEWDNVHPSTYTPNLKWFEPSYLKIWQFWTPWGIGPCNVGTVLVQDSKIHFTIEKWCRKLKALTVIKIYVFEVDAILLPFYLIYHEPCFVIKHHIYIYIYIYSHQSRQSCIVQ